MARGRAKVYVKRRHVNNGTGFTVKGYNNAKQAEEAVRRDRKAYAVVTDGRQMSRVRFLSGQRAALPELLPETPWEDCFADGGAERGKEKNDEE